MQALRLSTLRFYNLPDVWLESSRPVSFLASLAALPAQSRSGGNARGWQEPETELRLRPSPGDAYPSWPQGHSLQMWGQGGPGLWRPFASSQEGLDAGSEGGEPTSTLGSAGIPGSFAASLAQRQAGAGEGDLEGVAGNDEASDDEASDDEAPLPGGRRAEEIARMLQAKEDSVGGLETKAGAFGPSKREMEEWLSYFRMKVVDVNRTSRGSPTGGIGRFSALVVVGNSNGVIGLGMGKSTALGEAVKKANRQALKTLFYVPRYNQATILHPLVARYGKCKVTMYPRSSGRGAIASNLISDICRLAGIADIGVKVHGTRNVRNTVKALIQGFESQTIPQEQIELPILKADKQQQKRRKGLPTVQTAGLLNL